MSNSLHRYSLEKYRGKATRYTCPSCKHKYCFARYKDNETDTHLAEHVGRCDREVNCGHHFKPSEYFAENPTAKPEFNQDRQIVEYAPKPKVNIPYSVVEGTLRRWDDNTLVKWLRTFLPEAAVIHCTRIYLVGTSSHYKGGGCVFWFINKAREVRAGQVKKFAMDGHTATFIDGNSEKRKCQNVVHMVIRDSCNKKGLPLPEWLPGYLEQDLKIDCFFGEQLLSLPEYKDKPVAIVESPKTAIVASMYFRNYVWLAIGALSYLKRERCGAIAGKDVYLFPDLKATEAWQAKVRNELHGVANFTVSTYLESIATEEERAQGLDLCDYLEKIPYVGFMQKEIQAEILDGAKLSDITDKYMSNGYGLTMTEIQAAVKELINQHKEVA